MYCPQCGQQQAPGEMRFCSRCGLPLGGVNELLAHGGVLPNYAPPPAEQESSPRRRGVQQGVTLIMLGIIITSLFGILSSYDIMPELFTAIVAIIGFVGGPLRVLYALIFEEGARQQQIPIPYYAPPQTPASLSTPPRQTALPPHQGTPVSNWSQQQRHHHTAEIVSPPSVTENTTRLLEKEPETPER